MTAFTPRERTVSIGALQLDGGDRLASVEQRVTVYGPAGAGSTALVCHALTGSSRIADWWPQIAGGEESLFDARRWRVVGINALGSCYGSTGPRDGAAFPRVSVADIVRAQMRALDALGIERLDAVVGGSLGGMQALQWALDAPGRVARAFVIGAHDHHSAMGIAFNALQREALGFGGTRGLRLARKIAMLTYKSDELLRARHDRRPDRNDKPYFDVEGYLDCQADLFESRMDAASYEVLTHAMDGFDVRGAVAPPEGASAALTFVGIPSDRLFLSRDVAAAAQRFRSHGWPARYLELPSDHGHDAFLAQGRALRELLEPYIV